MPNPTRNIFKKIFDVVSDIYLNSTFPETEMQKEKGVIIEEINMYEDMPNRHVQDLMMKLLYGDQPAGWNIAGEKRKIF
jgi:predicted Zn-dependent peptidase